MCHGKKSFSSCNNNNDNMFLCCTLDNFLKTKDMLHTYTHIYISICIYIICCLEMARHFLLHSRSSPFLSCSLSTYIKFYVTGERELYALVQACSIGSIMYILFLVRMTCFVKSWKGKTLAIFEWHVVSDTVKKKTKWHEQCRSTTKSLCSGGKNAM